jgi:hypothetical protein
MKLTLELYADDNWISLGSEVMIGDSHGNIWNCSMSMRRASYAPDLFVKHSKSTLELWDDSIFAENVTNYFRKRGYEGPVMSRAELGMQSNSEVAFEVFNPEWKKFAKKRGWVDLLDPASHDKGCKK